MIFDTRPIIKAPPTRRGLLLAGASILGVHVAGPAFAAGAFAPIIPGSVQPDQLTPAAQSLAESNFGMSRDPTVTSQNARLANRPGRGPDIPNWPRPGETRQIWLKRPQSGEEVVARYYANGQLDMGEYLKVCRIMRDVRGGVAAYIDVEVLDLVFAMQKWLVSWGIDKPIIVQSGYRSPATNNNTEGAAKNSLHLQGQALDIRMPGVPVAYLGRLASIFGVGGVGFYVSQNFVHTDTGRIRYWKA